jgi:hypothetical protein
MAMELVANGLRAVRSRHTCARRVDELMSTYADLTAARASSKRKPAETELLRISMPLPWVANLADSRSSDEAQPSKQL